MAASSFSLSREDARMRKKGRTSGNQKTACAVVVGRSGGGAVSRGRRERPYAAHLGGEQKSTDLDEYSPFSGRGRTRRHPQPLYFWPRPAIRLSAMRQ